MWVAGICCYQLLYFTFTSCDAVVTSDKPRKQSLPASSHVDECLRWFPISVLSLLASPSSILVLVTDYLLSAPNLRKSTT